MNDNDPDIVDVEPDTSVVARRRLVSMRVLSREEREREAERLRFIYDLVGDARL